MSIDRHTDIATIPTTVEALRNGFDEGRTRPLEWRQRQLDGLVAVLTEGADDLVAAMADDFGKPRVEAYTTDIAFTMSEVAHNRKHVAEWMKPQKAKLRLKDMPGKAFIQAEPLGVALIIAPWNYPVQLLVAPMAAALAAGNAVVAKPSEVTAHTSRVLADLLRRHLDPDAVAIVEGGPDVATALLEQRFDHIFFTGSTAVGRIVARAAAEHLTPTVLELGGKSPVIIDDDVDLAVAAHRIGWGKFLNAGQTCIAPDYVLISEARRDEFVAGLVDVVDEFYGERPETSADFAQIVNDRHVSRLEDLLASHGGTTVIGGKVDATTRKLAPTIVVDPDVDSPLMREEIFGPVLPIVSVADIGAAVSFINERDKPLALYVFSESSETVDAVVDGTSSGGVCVNHTLFHITPPSLPFGGVGPSGQGRYHGRAGFDEFSNAKPVLRKPTSPDLPLAYPPYTNLKAKVLERLV